MTPGEAQLIGVEHGRVWRGHNVRPVPGPGGEVVAYVCDGHLDQPCEAEWFLTCNNDEESL